VGDRPYRVAAVLKVARLPFYFIFDVQLSLDSILDEARRFITFNHPFRVIMRFCNYLLRAAVQMEILQAHDYTIQKFAK
jgi:hypothetical protein